MDSPAPKPASLSDETHRQLAHLAAIVESSDDAIIGKDLNSVITSWNQAAEKIFGYTAAEMIGSSILRLIPEDRLEEEERILSKIMRGERLDHFETVRLTKDHQLIHVSVTTSPIMDLTGKIVGTSKIVRNITDSKHAHEAKQASDVRYRTLFEYAPTGILIADPHGNYLDANAEISRMLGYSTDELVGMKASDIVAPVEIPNIAPALAAINNSSDYFREWLFRRKDASTFTAEVIATTMPDGNILAFIRDISERQLLESQLRQAQKMEAVGQFAAGVAHDFNNQITVVVGFAQLIKDSLTPDDPSHKMLEEIIASGERSAALTQQLLAFSRKQVLAPKILDLNHVIQNTEKILSRMIGEDVHLITAPHPSLDRVKADPGQIEQILFNLAVNARDAMPHGGKLTIETHNVELGDDYAKKHPYILPGRYVMLAVTDSGTGIAPDVQKHIFEPFFTTKEVGKGTGLGLSVVHGIVKQSGGSIEVYSEPGVGTCFKIYFPRIERESVTSSSQTAPSAPVRGTETILLVEDEHALRTLSSQVLQQRGYTVFEAANADLALQIAADPHKTIHLLITDVVMPGIGGRLLAEKLLLLRPQLKVLYISGYTDDAVVRHGILHENVNFLRKPFTPVILCQKVREVLQKP